MRRQILLARLFEIYSPSVGLMMFLCTSGFDIKEQDTKLLKECFTHDEIEAAKE